MWPRGATAVTIMDDKTVPTSAWLAFSLSQPNAVSLCRRLRESCPDPVDAGRLIQQHTCSAATAQKVDEALAWQAAAANRHLLGLDHPAYPALLQDTLDAPLILYAEGSLDALNCPLVATVGSRKASHAALTHTRTVCAELAAMHVGIVSGLAIGIDGAAHEAALSVGGITIAVAATAPCKVYPRQHIELAKRILDSGGLILTEYGLGSVTRPWHFPQRNRIISGISLGVLVAEASLPSGTLTTATHAMNQGREVMAVPGSVHNLQARGCHALIKQGAALVETAQDVVDVLGQPLQRHLQACAASDPQSPEVTVEGLQGIQGSLLLQDNELDACDRQIVDWLAAQPASLDELVALADAEQQSWSLSQISSALGLLEIRGYITTTTAGRYARC